MAKKHQKSSVDKLEIPYNKLCCLLQNINFWSRLHDKVYINKIQIILMQFNLSAFYKINLCLIISNNLNNKY
jgi:hypothetical protein